MTVSEKREFGNIGRSAVLRAATSEARRAEGGARRPENAALNTAAEHLRQQADDYRSIGEELAVSYLFGSSESTHAARGVSQAAEVPLIDWSHACRRLAEDVLSIG